MLSADSLPPKLGCVVRMSGLIPRYQTCKDFKHENQRTGWRVMNAPRVVMETSDMDWNLVFDGMLHRFSWIRWVQGSLHGIGKPQRAHFRYLGGKVAIGHIVELFDIKSLSGIHLQPADFLYRWSYASISLARGDLIVDAYETLNGISVFIRSPCMWRILIEIKII